MFPAIRRLCEQRGVAFSEVDLRWGVTDEQKAEGAVLPICLAEIDRSRPYFIGLLGQRYGWVPESLPDDLTAQLPWLRDLTDTSVTEMEILHGVLNDPAAIDSAFFYLRDPAWMADATNDQLALLGEQPSTEEIAARWGRRRPARCGGAAGEARRVARTDPCQRRARLRLRRHPYARRACAHRLGRTRRPAVSRIGCPRRRRARETSAHDAYSAAQLRGTVRRPAVEAQLDAWAERRAGAADAVGPTRFRNDRDRCRLARPVARHAPGRCRHPPPRSCHRRRRAVGADGEQVDGGATIAPTLRRPAGWQRRSGVGSIDTVRRTRPAPARRDDGLSCSSMGSTYSSTSTGAPGPHVVARRSSRLWCACC